MLDHEIAECCKQLRLSRNLAEMAQSVRVKAIRNIYTTYCLRNFSIEKMPV